jgi:hypothetical protein
MNGSEIAKSGYKNEHDIVEMFNKWQDSQDAKKMLEQMGYRPDTLSMQDVKAVKIPGTVKSDIKITIKGEDKFISAKKYIPTADYNHVARSSVDNYHKIFNFDQHTLQCLKVFTGEQLPCVNPAILAKDEGHIKSHKRANLREIKDEYVQSTIEFFKKNLRSIVDYIFCGNGSDGTQPDYMIITEVGDDSKYYLLPMKKVVDFYLSSGKVTLQRKGGTGSPTNLQFKFKPSKIINEGHNNE